MKSSIWPRWLRALFAWRDRHSEGVWLYQENTVTGERRAVRVVPGGYQPQDRAWLERLPPSPVAPPHGAPATFRVRTRPAARCISCRFWDSFTPVMVIRGRETGECRLHEGDGYGGAGRIGAKAWAVGRGPDGHASLAEFWTHADFGCVSHEHREEASTDGR